MTEQTRKLYRIFLSQETKKLVEILEESGDWEGAQEVRDIDSRLSAICCRPIQERK